MPIRSHLPPAHLLGNVVLVLLFVSAALTDLKWNRIFNVQTFPAMALGLALGTLGGGLRGALGSLAGLVVGLALLLAFYFVGGVGAGDVKLLGAIGSLKGAGFVVWTMFYAGLIGGVMACAVVIWQGRTRQTFRNLLLFLRHPARAVQNEEAQQDSQYLPYGVAISAGCLCALWVA